MTTYSGRRLVLPSSCWIGGLLRAENRVCCDDDKCRVGNWSVCPFGLGLGIFEFVDIFQDDLTIEMIALHLVFKSKDINGIESPTRCLEVGDHFPCGDEGVICPGTLELSYPCIFYYVEDEFPSLALCGFKCRVVAAPNLVHHLLLGVDQ